MWDPEELQSQDVSSRQKSPSQKKTPAAERTSSPPGQTVDRRSLVWIDLKALCSHPRESWNTACSPQRFWGSKMTNVYQTKENQWMVRSNWMYRFLPGLTGQCFEPCIDKAPSAGTLGTEQLNAQQAACFLFTGQPISFECKKIHICNRNHPVSLRSIQSHAKLLYSFTARTSTTKLSLRDSEFASFRLTLKGYSGLLVSVPSMLHYKDHCRRVFYAVGETQPMPWVRHRHCDSVLLCLKRLCSASMIRTQRYPSLAFKRNFNIWKPYTIIINPRLLHLVDGQGLDMVLAVFHAGRSWTRGWQWHNSHIVRLSSPYFTSPALSDLLYNLCISKNYLVTSKS